MEICSSGHDEICYDTRHCPACVEIDEKNSEIEDLKSEIENLKNQLVPPEPHDF